MSGEPDREAVAHALNERLDLIMQHAQPAGLDRPLRRNEANRSQQPANSPMRR